MTTSTNDLREALARVVSDQPRDADLIVNDIYTVLREYGRAGWSCPLCDRTDWPGLQPPDWAKGNEIHIRRDKKGNCEGTPVPVMVLPMPDQEPTT